MGYKRRGGDEEEGSASSALSPHSHRHLPDLDEDDSACEEELARLAAQVNSPLLPLTERPIRPKRSPACDV